MLAPLIQKGAVNVAPAWTLLAIVILGALFGVLRLYVEDWLHDRPHASA